MARLLIAPVSMLATAVGSADWMMRLSISRRKLSAMWLPQSNCLGRALKLGYVVGASRSMKIGRAHVCTPVTNAHLVCRLLVVQTTNYSQTHTNNKATDIYRVRQ